MRPRDPVRSPSQQKFIESQNPHETTRLILELKNAGLLSHGRNSKESLRTLIRENFNMDAKINHSVEWDSQKRELFELGGGLKNYEHIGQGAYGTAKIARKINETENGFDYGDWYVAKVPAKTGSGSRNKKLDAQFPGAAKKEVDAMVNGMGYNARYLARGKFDPTKMTDDMIAAPGKLYLKCNDTNLEYKVQDANGKLQNGSIPFKRLPKNCPHNLDHGAEAFLPYMDDILKITARAGHTLDPTHAPGTILMPYFEKSPLSSYLSNSKLSRSERFRCMEAVLDAINTMHLNGYAHLDIKPDNIIYNPETGTAYLIDFGLSRPIKYPLSTFQSGTLYYMDPRIQQSSLPNSEDIRTLDLWSLAVTFAEILGIDNPAEKIAGEFNILTLLESIQHSPYGTVLLGMMQDGIRELESRENEQKIDLSQFFRDKIETANQARKTLTLMTEPEVKVESETPTPSRFSTKMLGKLSAAFSAIKTRGFKFPAPHDNSSLIHNDRDIPSMDKPIVLPRRTKISKDEESKKDDTPIFNRFRLKGK